jgi:hypothetical protein
MYTPELREAGGSGRVWFWEIKRRSSRSSACAGRKGDHFYPFLFFIFYRRSRRSRACAERKGDLFVLLEGQKRKNIGGWKGGR